MNQHPSELFDSPVESEADLVNPELGLSDQDEKELNDELAELLAESVGGVRPSNGVDLESLLAESMGAVADERATRAARERLKRGGQSALERAEDAARVAAWEAAHEWEAIASVAMFEDSRCKCGMSARRFAGLFTREAHRHLKTAERWRRVEASDAKLPNETALRVIYSPMCESCAFDKGWDLAKAYDMIEAEDRRAS